jgi:ribosomal protein S18 acetylase RimI-like enzyme
MGEPGSDGGSLVVTRPGLSLTLRDGGNGDDDLLRQLFETGRGAPLLSCDLPPVLVDQLIAHQLVARQRDHARNHPLARRQIVLTGDGPVGSLSVDRTGEPWYLVDLAVLPTARGRGIATELLARLLAEAGAARVAVELHVDAENPAERLYRRNGFTETAREGPDLRLRWAPE